MSKFIRIVNGEPTGITDPEMLKILQDSFTKYFEDEQEDEAEE